MQQRPTLRDPKIFLLTFFGIGFVPIAPGTAGTLATIPLVALWYHFHLPLIPYLALLLLLTIVSSIAAERAQKKYNVHDPSWIVVDEVIGMALTWAFIQELNWYHGLALFILFRGFDIAKIWPASYYDKKMTHGFGTIADDIVSGFYAGLTYLGALKIYSLLA